MLSYINLPENALLAVSGGGDSVGLAWMYRLRNLPASIGHVRHGKSEWQLTSEKFVRELSDELHYPFFSKTISTQSRGGQGFEAKSRRLRYAALVELALHFSLDTLVTAHTRDDFAETVAIAIHRKQGIAALKGIPEQRVLHQIGETKIDVARPLLQVTREALREEMRREKISWLDDPTNDDPAYALRNSIRSEWAKLSPTAYEAKLQEMEAIALDAKSRWLNAESLISISLPEWNEPLGEQLSFPSSRLLQFTDDALQVLFSKVAKNFGVESGSIPQGHRKQFASILLHSKWGSRGMLGSQLKYRLTKQECRFSRL